MLNSACLQFPSTTQEIRASAFAQGLLDGDFFKFLAKKPATKFDVLLAWAVKYINMEDAHASMRKGRGKRGRRSRKRVPLRNFGRTLKTKNHLRKE
ncbi:UNVERIFIED_CONTAM: hypothetical protein Slati_1135600 [Sesamum latifolium]|uniref:Uncharacterized protein n=1 Tax=Sesamum latifolium TaxID=2727402 RepID=A0AAW2XI54_9LAMI